MGTINYRYRVGMGPQRPGKSWNFIMAGKRPLVLESTGNLLNASKNMKCLEGSKEN